MKRHILASVALLCLLMGLTACHSEYGDGVKLKGIQMGEDFRMNLGTTASVPAYPIPWDCADFIFNYSSSDPEVVSVNEFGKLTANNVGEATITASCGSYTGTVNVTVYEITIGDKLQALDGLTGLWEFNQPNPYKATVGEDLVPYYHANDDELGEVTYEPCGYNQMEGFNKNDGAVLSTLAYSLYCKHGLPDPSVYTLVVDVLYPSAVFGKYTTILNSTSDNTGDQTIYFRKQGYTQFGGSGNRSTNAVSADKWYRCVFVKNGSQYMRTYVNGALWNDGTQTDRVVLEPVACLLDGDNDGDDRSLGWSTAAFFNRPLTEDEILGLGAP